MFSVTRLAQIQDLQMFVEPKTETVASPALACKWLTGSDSTDNSMNYIAALENPKYNNCI